MARFLAGWVVLGFGLACLWVGAIALLSGMGRRRRAEAPDPEPPRLIIFSASANVTAERECLRALEELWEASQ